MIQPHASQLIQHGLFSLTTRLQFTYDVEATCNEDGSTTTITITSSDFGEFCFPGLQ